ncbi:MAG: hypothetical protein ABF535_11145 [Acetobacter sp.]
MTRLFLARFFLAHRFLARPFLANLPMAGSSAAGPLAVGLCVALCLLLMVPPAHADDDPDNPPRSVWCSIGDQGSQRLFISKPSRLPRTSRMAVYTYGGRFARTVNMRFGMHVGIEGSYCHAFSTPHRAAMAHAALVARMADQNFKIVSVGIF